MTLLWRIFKPALAGVARLQCGDHPAALVAQAAPFVEFVRVSRSDKPAVTRKERQFGGKRTAEALDEGAVLAEPPLRRSEPLGQWHETRLGQHVAQSGGRPQRLAQCRKIARAAAAEAETGQTPLDVRAALQPLAQGLAQLRAVDKELDCVETRCDRGRLGQRRREVIGEEPRSGSRD